MNLRSIITQISNAKNVSDFNALVQLLKNDVQKIVDQKSVAEFKRVEELVFLIDFAPNEQGRMFKQLLLDVIYDFQDQINHKEDSTPDLESEIEIKSDTDVIRVLHRLGVLKNLHQRYKDKTGFENYTQLTKIIVKLGLTKTKKVDSLKKAVKSIMQGDGEINLQKEKIDTLFKDLKLD